MGDLDHMSVLIWHSVLPPINISGILSVDVSLNPSDFLFKVSEPLGNFWKSPPLSAQI